ncbi:cation:proton antiporter [Ramlibacter monticola]|uniref:Cation:proton antiporter n=1 Tax=Ramlibacter monticola TaxID=1926872 RepID=A0A937CSB6_9BURK|nr:cation:proton antiporter [Ramlibacter monticola]MBL0390379.1 cation:proton antiporter [Ramlibacter monticola]
MDHPAALPFLRETLLFLALVGILIPLLQRFRINQVVGFLVVGVIAGPYGSGSLAAEYPVLSWLTFPRQQGVQVLGDLGVIFLMFLIGLELSIQRVWELRRWVFGAGAGQVLLSGMVIGGLAWGFGNRPGVALVLGLVLSLSSTAVVMQLLVESRALATPVGQASFSVLMFQDVAVVPLLILVELVGKDSGSGLFQKLGFQMLASLLIVALILVLGPRLVRVLFRTLARRRQPEVFTALCLLVVLSIGGATAAAGLSMALGAFLAGLLLAETEYRHEVEITVEPFKGLLMGLFFMTVGMEIDPREVLREPGWITVSVVGLLAIKAIIAAGVLRASGLRWGQAIEAGLLLGQGGEFAFIIIGAGVAAGALTHPIGQFMFLVVSLSLLVTPVVARLAHRLGRWIDADTVQQQREVHESRLPGASGHVVVIGFGRVGRMLGEVLAAQQVPYIAVEHDGDRAARLREQGFPVYFGNAARVELLRKLKLDEAASLVVTMDSPSAARRVVKAAREQAPQLKIFARSHDEAHARELEAAGATCVVPEMLEAGLLLTSHALESQGLGAPAIENIIAAERTRRSGAPA